MIAKLESMIRANLDCYYRGESGYDQHNLGTRPQQLNAGKGLWGRRGLLSDSIAALDYLLVDALHAFVGSQCPGPVRRV